MWLDWDWKTCSPKRAIADACFEGAECSQPQVTLALSPTSPIQMFRTSQSPGTLRPKHPPANKTNPEISLMPYFK